MAILSLALVLEEGKTNEHTVLLKKTDVNLAYLISYILLLPYHPNILVANEG